MEEDLVPSIGRRVRELMAARGWNRAKLIETIRASGSDIGDGNVGRLLAGKGNPTLKTLSTVAGCFGLRAWELMATEEEVKKMLITMAKSRFAATPSR